MRTRVLLAGLAAIAPLVFAEPSSAKVDIAGATIAGPGLDHRLEIEAPDAHGLWDSGIDTEGGLDEPPAGSVEELGLAAEDLGPRYLVTYRFGIGRARQDLYPYARGGPVTFTRPGHVLGRGRNMPDFLSNLQIVTGWYQSDRVFFRYLVDRGLPKANPVPFPTRRESTLVTAPPSRTVPWAAIVPALVASAAVSGAALTNARTRRTR